VNPRYREVAGRAGHRCEYCRAPEAAFNFPFEVEHVTPPGGGGSDDLENLALACRSCNLYKANTVEAADPVGGELVRLFDPRRDSWAEHLGITEDDQIVGVSARGRVTVVALRMNSRPQLDARRWWRVLRLFP
jgi:hypothetical protein